MARKNVPTSEVDETVVIEQQQSEEIRMPKWSKRDDVKPIVSKLIEMYPDHLSHIRPSQIGYVAFSKKKSKKQAFVAPVRPMMGLFVDMDYILAVHIENWVQLDTSEKYLLVFHELFHIPTEGFDVDSKHYRKTVDHDVKDFAYILQHFGIHWEDAEKILKVKREHDAEREEADDESEGSKTK